MNLRNLERRIDILVERTGQDLPRVEFVGYGKRDYPGEPDGTLCGGGPIFRYDAKPERDAIRERIATLPDGPDVHRIVMHFISAEEIAEEAAAKAVAL
jgi:hypothetical protein